jgi:hypothetical protein
LVGFLMVENASASILLFIRAIYRVIAPHRRQSQNSMHLVRAFELLRAPDVSAGFFQRQI